MIIWAFSYFEHPFKRILGAVWLSCLCVWVCIFRDNRLKAQREWKQVDTSFLQRPQAQLEAEIKLAVLFSAQKTHSKKYTHVFTQHTAAWAKLRRVGHTHTLTSTHTQGHTDTPVCSDKLPSETPVGLLFTFSHRRHHPLEKGCQGMLGNSHSDLIVLHTHTHVHTDKKLSCWRLWVLWASVGCLLTAA